MKCSQGAARTGGTAWVRLLGAGAATVAIVAGGGGVAGCGGDSEPDEAALEEAREEGVRQARQQARIRALEEELDEVKDGEDAASAVPAAGSSTSVPQSSVVSPYISTFAPYIPTVPGYDDYVAEVPTGGGWSGPSETFPTGGALLRSQWRGPDGTMVLIDRTPDEVPQLGGSYDSVDTSLETNFGPATTYTFSASERLPECNGRPCVDIFINDGSGGGWAVLGGGPSLPVAQAIAEHVAQSIGFRGE